MDDKKHLKEEGLLSKVENNRNSVGRPKGHPKSGGRAPGTPNSKTLALKTELELRGFSLPDAIINLYQNAQSDSVRLALIELIVKYSLPLPTVKQEVATALDVSVTDIMAAVE